MLSIIIVNYKSSKLIFDCLTSAKQFDSYGNFEWIVVDNASNDESEVFLRNMFPFIKWIQMCYNAGFARANNEGIRQSKGDTVLLLNPDTLILNNAIEASYQQFRLSNCTACGVQLLNEDKTPQISGHNFMKGGVNHLLALPYWGKALKCLAQILKVRKPGLDNPSSFEEVDWISGAFLMVDKKAIDKAGLLDEDFFLYAEEIEWCSRLKKVGKLYINGSIYVIHLVGTTITEISKSDNNSYQNLYDKKGFQLMLSNHLRIRKQYGIGWFLFQLANFTLTIPICFFCQFFNNVIHIKNPFSNFKKVVGFSRNVVKLWSYFFKILQNKPYFYKAL